MLPSDEKTYTSPLKAKDIANSARKQRHTIEEADSDLEGMNNGDSPDANRRTNNNHNYQIQIFSDEASGKKASGMKKNNSNRQFEKA